MIKYRLINLNSFTYYGKTGRKYEAEKGGQWENYGEVKLSKNKLLSGEWIKRRVKKWLMF